MTDPTAAELDAALRKLVEDELFAEAFETQRELNRVRLEMEETDESR